MPRPERNPHAYIGVPDHGTARLWHDVRRELGYRRLPSPPTAPPLIVGGTGGSGTRVIVEILQDAGYFPGAHLNRSRDSIPVTNFIRRWAPAYLAAGGRLAGWRARWMRHDLHAALAYHSRHAADGPWLVKDPRSILLLPFLATALPGSRFVQVVRDGRDMAYSRNQNQLRAYGAMVLGDGRDDVTPSRAIAYWSAVNAAAARFAAQQMPDRYHLLRYEALCRAPEATARALVQFAGIDAPDVARAAARVAPPASLGRWRDAPAADIAALEAIAGDTLRHFSYITTIGEQTV